MAIAPVRDPSIPLRNPNSEIQPRPGVHHDPAGARAEGLQVEQLFAHETLSAAIDRLKPTLAEEDYTALEVVEDLLHDGGSQEDIEAGADQLESSLAHLTPALTGQDLAALSASLVSMRFVSNHMRTGDTLPALPDAEPPPAPPEEDPPVTTRANTPANPDE